MRRQYGLKGRSHRLLRAAWQSGAPGVLLPLCVVLPASSVSGQSAFPLSVSVGTHALSVPWYPGPVADRFNPAFMVGTERSLRSGDRWALTFNVNLGFFHDHWWMTGLSVEPEVRIGRTLPGRLYGDMGLGLGYMHYFWRRKTLRLEDGRYVKATDWGRPSVIIPLSITLAYRGDPARPVRVSPFVSARWGVQGLFLNEIPVMTHLVLLGGVRIERSRRTGAGR